MIKPFVFINCHVCKEVDLNMAIRNVGSKGIEKVPRNRHILGAGGTFVMDVYPLYYASTGSIWKPFSPLKRETLFTPSSFLFSRDNNMPID